MTPGDETPPTTARVEAFLAAVYGLTGRVEPLSGENHNYRVDAAGERFALKIASQGQASSDFDLEHAVVEHLVAKQLPLALPRSVATTSGAFVATFDGARPARLARFVDGRPWAAVERPAEPLLEALGRAVATLTLALDDFRPPVAERSHRWAPTRALERQPGIGAVEDPTRRRILGDAFQLFAAGAHGMLNPLPRGWIHGDLNDENVLLDGDSVTGLIDFGDLLVEPRVCELAVALAYAMLGQPDPLAAGARVVAGYSSRRSLDDGERRVLFPLVCARLAISLAIAAERRSRGLERPALFVTEEPAWELLAALISVGPRAAAEALAGERPAAPRRGGDSLLERRRRRVGPSLALAYEEPLEIVRGGGQYLYDRQGRPYLDLVNNVCHVGHCHPHVVAAGQRQMARLNTNTRYLYRELVDYAERLTATLPDVLSVLFMVNSGSEANELALRLARAHTGRRDVLVVEGAYHGHTGRLIDISPYKFLGPGGSGSAPSWVHVVPMPDGYRGPHRGRDRATGAAYGDAVGEAIARAARPPGAFILESLLGCGGQIVPPPGYLETAFAHVRAAGGVCIADEVQVGFGRVGSHFWAFETEGVVPDVVVLGKPIGNGHPMAAVVTTREIADSFANGMEFFSTFGGNPVSCAIGTAVLDVIEEEGLQEHAAVLGERFLAGLASLAGEHELIGDVRGRGLFLGIELVRDRVTLEPAGQAAKALVERMRRRGVLLSTDGPLGNAVKIKPPMVLTGDDVDRALYLLDDELRGLPR